MAIRNSPEKNLYSEQHRGNFSYDEENQVNVFEPVTYIPGGGLDRLTTDNLALIVDDTTTADTIYIGKAKTGTSSSDSDWQIKKIDTTSYIVMTWADGDAEFNNVWDNRTSLSYS